MEYTYKPTVKAIRYTGSIDAVIEFFAPVKMKNIEWRGNGKERYIDIELEDILQNEICQPAINEYIVKHTLNEEIVKVEIMDEDEFNRYYKELTEPEPIVADITPKTGCVSPESGGAAMRNVLKAMEAAKVTSAPCEGKPDKRYISLTFEQIGDCTKEERKQLYDKVDLLMKYDNWRKQHDPVALVWVHEQFIPHDRKYYIENEYDYGLKPKIEFEFTYTARKLGALYFSTSELAGQFYAEHKDLIHRVLGVE